MSFFWMRIQSRAFLCLFLVSFILRHFFFVWYHCHISSTLLLNIPQSLCVMFLYYKFRLYIYLARIPSKRCCVLLSASCKMTHGGSSTFLFWLFHFSYTVPHCLECQLFGFMHLIIFILQDQSFMCGFLYSFQFICFLISLQSFCPNSQ